MSNGLGNEYTTEEYRIDDNYSMSGLNGLAAYGWIGTQHLYIRIPFSSEYANDKLLSMSKEYRRKKHALVVAGHEVSEIAADGVKVGCTYVTWIEIEKLMELRPK